MREDYALPSRTNIVASRATNRSNVDAYDFGRKKKFEEQYEKKTKIRISNDYQRRWLEMKRATRSLHRNDVRWNCAKQNQKV